MDEKEIKKALDYFENDKFTDCKEILHQQIRSRKNEYLKDKLKLRNDIEDK